MVITTDVRWLNPFVVGALEVLRSLGLDASRAGTLSVEQDRCTSDEVTVIIPVSGALEGAVFFGMSEIIAGHLASAMAGDLRNVRWDDVLVESALGELGNMITGHASTLLEQGGRRCNIAPPVLALEARLIVASHPFERLVVPIETGFGTMRIHLALRENPQATADS